MTQFDTITSTNLQSFLHSFQTDEDLQKYSLEKGILFTQDAELGLTILRYNREHENCSFNDSFTRFCRGLIYENETRNIVCFPPEKYVPLENFEYPDFSELVVENFEDGTMINMFFYQDSWHISTRSKIGAHGTWFTQKKFSDMFTEAKGNLDFGKFETNYTYTFVLRHPENRIVTHYAIADLVLVQVRDIHNSLLVNNYMVKQVLVERGVHINIPVLYNFTDMEQLKHHVSQMNFEQQGIVVKYGNQRSKIRNEKYQMVKSMRGNTPNLFYNYLELCKMNDVGKYLKYFPEFGEIFHQYRYQINGMIRCIHISYMNYRVKKAITLEDVQYEIRPLLYELHGHHITNGIRITPDYVRSYFMSLPTKKIIFVVNYQKNQILRESQQTPLVSEENKENFNSVLAELETVE